MVEIKIKADISIKEVESLRTYLNKFFSTDLNVTIDNSIIVFNEK